MLPTLSRRSLIWVLSAISLVIMVTAVAQAMAWYGHPVPGMVFVDPGGVVSNLGAPNWTLDEATPRFPEVVRSVDDKELVAREGEPRAAVWDREIERAYQAGAGEVTVILESEQGQRSTALTVEPLSPLAWWVYAGACLFAGGLYVLAGLTALWVAPHSKLARAFGKVGLFFGVLGILNFDFHTSRLLAPIFLVAFALLPGSWLTLALRLPEDVGLLRRAPWIESAIDAVGVFVGACFLYLYWSGQGTRGLQMAWTLVTVAAFLSFAVIFLVRFRYSKGVARSRMRALLLSVLPPHLAIAALAFPVPHGPIAEAITYGTLSLFPIATAYAFIRYDLWGSRALLSRFLTRVISGAVACVVAIGLGTAVAVQLGAPFGVAIASVTFGGVCAAAFVLAVLGVVDRQVFRARAQYKPTVEQLSEELISINSPDDVARSVERTIQRWLKCEFVQLSVAKHGALDSSSGLRWLDARESETPLRQTGYLTLPVDFGGARLGTLRVGSKDESALFTDEDLDLLRTIVNQGALALAHAFAYQELEARRQEQVAAWRGERAALIETVAAEVAHEIRYPINFFRSIFEHGEKGRPLDLEEVEIGLEEVDRLERLVSGLRRMAASRIERREVRVAELCDRVETLLRDSLGHRRLERAVPDRAEIRCDTDQATQILTNLVANALQAAGDGAVGIAWSQGARAAELVVWDTGPGFDGDPAKLFAPWYTTKPKGTGLGLAITHRLVRAHGWNIAASRRDNRTLFVVSIPAEDVVLSGDGPAVGKRSAEVA